MLQIPQQTLAPLSYYFDFVLTIVEATFVRMIFVQVNLTQAVVRPIFAFQDQIRVSNFFQDQVRDWNFYSPIFETESETHIS